MCMLSCFRCVWLFATLWIVACQAPLSMGFSRQEYWSGLPSPPPGSLPYPGIEVMSLMSPALSGRFFTSSTSWEAPIKGCEVVKLLSHVQLFVIPWTVVYQAPLSMAFSRQEYWSGLLFPSPGDLPDTGIKLGPPTLQADSLPSEPARKPLVFLDKLISQQ